MKQTIKGFGLIVTGGVITIATIVWGGAAFGYIADTMPDIRTDWNAVIYIIAIIVAVGWQFWLSFRFYSAMVERFK